MQHTDSVQFSSRLQKKSHLFQIRGFGGNLNAGNLAQKFSRRVRGGMLWADNNVSDVANPEFHPVIALQFLPLYPLAIHVGAMLASLIHHEKIDVLGYAESMLSR